jgi:hypothetical protein
MKTKLITPKAHGIIDYALTAGLLVIPAVSGFSKKVRTLYAAEALVLLGYIAVTDHPAAVKPLIPFKVHGKVDRFNIAQFALQTLLPMFLKDRKARLFNIAFTAAAGAVVALTDFDAPAGKQIL